MNYCRITYYGNADFSHSRSRHIIYRASFNFQKKKGGVWSAVALSALLGSGGGYFVGNQAGKNYVYKQLEKPAVVEALNSTKDVKEGTPKDAIEGALEREKIQKELGCSPDHAEKVQIWRHLEKIK